MTTPRHAMRAGGKPVRLQLSRKKGFNLQALSMATNGLPAVNVARPSKWGNPFRIGIDGATQAEVVAAHACYCRNGWWPLRDPKELRGKNLACWCPIGTPCHADTLLEVANEVQR